jgi:hypothetical protein
MLGITNLEHYMQVYKNYPNEKILETVDDIASLIERESMFHEELQDSGSEEDE